jgi:hypothetical protein
MLICVCLHILASSRIPDMILGDKPLISEMVLSHMASIYLVNVSTPMNKYIKLLGALGKMPMMSILQTAKGQEISVG